jgi:cytochrome b
MSNTRIKLWDLPIRVFHWLLVLIVVLAVISGQIGGALIDWHARIGLVILGLVVFRVVWGVVGSSHARFASFFPTPASLRAYLRGQWRGVGHNPLGAFSVFGLLGLLALQVGTGLLSNDDIAFNGPLARLIDKGMSDRLSGLHELVSNLLIALVILHIGAIAFYVRVKKDNLLLPMITGWKEVESGQGKSASGGGALAFALAIVIALAAVYGASGEWIAAPPPVPAAATPSW